MGVDFSFERWKQTEETYRLWWEGELGRPVFPWTVKSRNPGRAEPNVPYERVMAYYDFSVAPEEIVDRYDYELSKYEFIGDGFPRFWPNFGAGVVAAFLGAETKATDQTVWFLEPDEREIEDIHFEYDADNPWLNRIKDICRAAVDRWQGLVQISMTDLGGNLDILSTFRPSEKLLLDLYDKPEEVKRLTWEAHELWHRYYGEINEIIAPTNHGYTAWGGILSDRPSYMLQCDFCYMISPQMFEEFVRPELVATCGRLGRSFYHLDGIGQIPHLDSLLAIEDLGGVQWIAGDGQPAGAHWMDIYRKILSAGKRAQLYEYREGVEVLEALNKERPGLADGGLVLGAGGPEDGAKLREKFKRFGAE